jgi:NADH-quinone oxidoreductase subunit G
VEKTNGVLLACVPGQEPSALNALPEHAADVVEELAKPGAVILVGERAAEVPGLFSAVAALAERTGAKVAWIPRRAGERGALEAGALPTLLPGGRLVSDEAARAAVEQAWGLEPGALPTTAGRDTAGILSAAASGGLDALVVGGVDPFDLPDPALAERALDFAGFVVSLELRHSAVTAYADVVLPVAPAVEKAGSYLNWEGRPRPFVTTLEGTGALPDGRVLDTLAVEMDADLFTQTPAAAAADLARLGVGAVTAAAPTVPAPLLTQPKDGQAVLATWRRLLDNGSLQDDEPNLAGTARAVVAKLSPATAAHLGVELGGEITVSTDRGEVVLPVEAADLPDGVVWLPGNSGAVTVRRNLVAGHGSVVAVSSGGKA